MSPVAAMSGLPRLEIGQHVAHTRTMPEKRPKRPEREENEMAKLVKVLVREYAERVRSRLKTQGDGRWLA